MIHGENMLSGALLAILGIHKNDVPRYRDCYFDGKHIIIYTRTGGGNRDDYAGSNDELCKLHGYLFDEDDDYDCTYANFHYKVPEQFNHMLDKLQQFAQNKTQSERWQDTLKQIESSSIDDPLVKRMTEAFAPLFESIENSIDRQS